MKGTDMMNTSEEQQLSELLTQFFNKELPSERNKSLVDYYNMDSLDAIELVLEMEFEFDIKLDDKSFEKAIHDGFDALLQLIK